LRSDLKFAQSKLKLPIDKISNSEKIFSRLRKGRG
jgi:hypothetical protein